MPDTKITALAAIGANPIIPSTFPIPMVDLTDTSMAASGTTKKVTVNQILGAGGTATLASATITGDLTVDTSTLKVDSANNRVGVNTATPRASFALDVLGNVALGNSTTTTSNRLKLDCSGTAGNVAVMSFAAAGTTKAFYGLSGGFLGDTSTDAMVATDAAGASIRFFVSDTATEVARFNSTGNLAFANGKGIDFSASPNAPGATSELLNDYEEGTFVPTVTTSAGTLTTTTVNEAVYTKIGRLVSVAVDISIVNVGTASGQLFFSLPFNQTVQSNVGALRELGATGQMGQIIYQSGTQVSAALYNNGTLIVNGYRIRGTYTYTV